MKRADTDLAIAAKLLLWRSERRYYSRNSCASTVLVPNTRLSNVAVKWVAYSADEDIILQFVTRDQQNTC